MAAVANSHYPPQLLVVSTSPELDSMSAFRTKLARFWLQQFVKSRLDRSETVVELRKVADRIRHWNWRLWGVDVQPELVADLNAELHVPIAAGETADVLLYLHGGGYNFGSAANYRELGSRLALSSQARVLVPDYRLAPEHPYPVALNDALGCYRWLLDQGTPPQKLAVAGDSAGGGLTLALLLKLKQEGLPLPAAAVCLSPWTDLSCTGESYDRLASVDPMLTQRALRECAKRYADGHDVTDPFISPVHGDLSGLPPLLIQVGSDEILLSDSQRVFEAAQAAGVEVTLEVLDDLWHVAHLFARYAPDARPAIARIGEFLRQAWNGD